MNIFINTVSLFAVLISVRLQTKCKATFENFLFYYRSVICICTESKGNKILFS